MAGGWAGVPMERGGGGNPLLFMLFRMVHAGGGARKWRCMQVVVHVSGDVRKCTQVASATHLFHTQILASGCVRRPSRRTESAGWHTRGNPLGVAMAGGS